MKPQKVTSIFLFKSILILLSLIIISYPLGELVGAQSDVSAIVEEVAPAVVKIETGEGGGSGFIINADGYIITNYHVVQKATSIRVIRHGGEEYEATLVDFSETLEEGGSDLALLKIEEEHLPTVELGNSNELRIGNSIIALGYPLGSFSVNTGILSSKLGEGDEKILQISAPINPGNSGAPLVNKRGEVIGIVFSKASAKGFLEKYGFIPEGIAFAIPINIAKVLFKITEEGLPRIPKPRIPTPKRLIYELDPSSWPSPYPWSPSGASGVCEVANTEMLKKPTFKDFVLEVDVGTYTYCEDEYLTSNHWKQRTSMPIAGILFGVKECDETSISEEFVSPFIFPDTGSLFWIDFKNQKYSLDSLSKCRPWEWEECSHLIDSTSSYIHPPRIEKCDFSEKPEILRVWPSDWEHNHIKIAVRGSSIWIYIDGHLLAKKDGISPSSGHIGVTSLQGTFLIKNLRVYSIE